MHACMHIFVCLCICVYVCVHDSIPTFPKNLSFERNHHLTKVPVDHYIQYEKFLIFRIESCYLIRDYRMLLPSPAQAGEAIQVRKSCGFGVWDCGVWH